MSGIRTIDMLLLDELFDMGQGYVLNFSDKTLPVFFAEELNVDIDHQRYRVDGNSKAKRTRCYLRTVNDQEAVRALNALWNYRNALLINSGQTDPIKSAEGRFLALTRRLEGKPAIATAATSSVPAHPAFDWPRLRDLKVRLVEVSKMPPQPRGYAFEKFLQELFNLYGMDARPGFRLTGEQIDGSFQLSGETYLLEAKWHSAQTPAADLRNFHGKLEEKAAWSRGLFISQAGFTSDAFVSFGRGKRLICMDGLDLYDTLEREIPLDKVLERKIRRAAESGVIFESVRTLFP